MNDRIRYSSNSLNTAVSQLDSLKDVLSDVTNGLSRVNTSDEWWGKISVYAGGGRQNARSALRSMRTEGRKITDRVSDTQRGIRKTISAFDAADRKMTRAADRLSQGTAFDWGTGVYQAGGKDYFKDFWKRFTQGTLAGAGYVGDIAGFVQDLFEVENWADGAKLVGDSVQFWHDAAKSWSNYQRVGNAVGKSKATTWWFKKATGLRPKQRVSSAKSFSKRVKGNLTNKTSPYNLKATWKNFLDGFKGKKGAGRAFASWGALILDGVSNWFSNREEQEQSGGTMSDGRVLAETVTETAVSTGLNVGMGAIVGGVVAAVAGTVAAPEILIAAATAAVVAGINVGVEALKGKTLTEWISDGILDFATGVFDKVGNAMKSMGNSVGEWFNSLSGAFA